MIDWKLATTVAEGIANLKPAPDAAPFEHVAGPADEDDAMPGRVAGIPFDLVIGNSDPRAGRDMRAA